MAPDLQLCHLQQVDRLKVVKLRRDNNSSISVRVSTPRRAYPMPSFAKVAFYIIAMFPFAAKQLGKIART